MGSSLQFNGNGTNNSGNGIITNKFSWKIAGEAGDGILNAGLMLARMCQRAGLWVFASAEYPSLIRGGHNHLDVRIDAEEIHSHTKYTNLLVAMNKDSIEKHAQKIPAGGAIIYDLDTVKQSKEEIAKEIGRDDVILIPMQLLQMANKCGGKIMRNVIAMGATIALLDFDLEVFNGVIKDNFGVKKGEQIAAANIAAAKIGYDYIKQNFASNPFNYRLTKQENEPRIFLSGNESASAGAIRAGCKFFSGYPMTPASSVMHVMAANEKNYGIVVKHTEDEIAAINTAIGAAFAGVRAMTATSGGGFALMVEALGLAAQTEVPLVIIESQRPGPATGMATHSGQGDLRFVLHAGTDEFPRVVVAPGDQEECYYTAFDAFNISDRYQIPVIVMLDKYVSESYRSIPEFKNGNLRIDRGALLSNEQAEAMTDYKRYSINDTGISPRAVPGQKNCMHTASSYEHDEEGHECEEEDNRVRMHNKRYRKFDLLSKEIHMPEIVGDADAEITIVGWGSTKGPIKEAMKMLQKEGIKVNYLQIKYISPFPTPRVAEVMVAAKRTLLIENNKTGLLGSVIREMCGMDFDYKMFKYDGRAFSPEDIAAGIKNILRSEQAGEKLYTEPMAATVFIE